MELTSVIEIIEKIGLPGFVVIAVVIFGKVLWMFFTDTYWPHMCARQEADDARRERQAQREADQWTWIVQELSSVTANLQKVSDGQRRLENACWEMKLQSIFETQPIDPEKVKQSQQGN